MNGQRVGFAINPSWIEDKTMREAMYPMSPMLVYEFTQYGNILVTHRRLRLRMSTDLGITIETENLDHLLLKAFEQDRNWYA